MFKNLRAEMIRQNISIEQISQALEIKPDSFRRKMSGKTNFTLAEAKKIKSLFLLNNSLDYLFE